jgi:toxin ParE1/3/4
MARYVLSPRAQADLDEIWDYSASTWGNDRTERYIRELWQGILTVAADPRRGQSIGAIRAGYFKYAVGSHVLFYRRLVDGVDVVRILHQRMDFQRHL